jgi:hypothetical protein
MSYDFAVWEGERPEDDAAATKYYMDHINAVMDTDEPPDIINEPPTPRIRAYVEALLERWPDIDTEEGSNSPWADGPLLSMAWGRFIYFPMGWSVAEEASAFAADVAQQHGLICYDPVRECLRP